MSNRREFISGAIGAVSVAALPYVAAKAGPSKIEDRPNVKHFVDLPVGSGDITHMEVFMDQLFVATEGGKMYTISCDGFCRLVHV